jgi:hypothetical protein
MKKWYPAHGVLIAAGLALIGVVMLLTTCAFETPESVRIKGNPGVYISLGSPFVRADGTRDPDKDLGSFLSRDKIKQMMASDGEGSLAELDEPDKDILTYVARFPIADEDMSYLANIPGIQPPNGPTRTITEKFESDFSELTGFGMKFHKVTGYIYASGLGSSAKFSYNTESAKPITPVSSIPDISAPGFSLPTPSVEIDLTNLYNSGGALNYKIEFRPSELVSGTHITIVMIIKLPLEFEVDAVPGGLMPEGYQKENYVKFDFKDAFDSFGDGGGGDLFGRKGGDDDMLKGIKDITIEFKNKKNDILPSNFLMVLDAGSKVYAADFAKETPSLVINEIPASFTIKKLEILFPKENGQNYALFPIKKRSDNRFDFDLALSARVGLDYPINFMEKN